MMVDVLSAVLRSLSFVALLQAAGATLFLFLFGSLVAASHGAVRRMAFASALIAIVLVIAQYLLEAARMSGGFAGAMDPSLQRLALQTPAAQVLAWRLTGLIVVTAALRTQRLPGGVFGLLLIASSFALTGHTTTHPHRWVLAPLLVLHTLVVSFWFGALAPLYIASLRETASATRELIDAFSQLAVRIVPILLFAGLCVAAALLGSLAALRSTYGALLMVKLALFAVLMSLAALNKWRLGPAIDEGNPRVAITFRRSLALEYALIVTALCVTAVLTSFYSPD